MPWVTLRHFVWSERTTATGTVEVAGISRGRAHTRLHVDVAELIYVNALAPAGATAVKYATRVHELALITTYLSTRSDDALMLNGADFKSSSAHIKRLVAESFGLGMLTATVEALHRRTPQGGLHNFDALPVALARAYARSGPVQISCSSSATTPWQVSPGAGPAPPRRARGRNSARNSTA